MIYNRGDFKNHITVALLCETIEHFTPWNNLLLWVKKNVYFSETQQSLNPVLWTHLNEIFALFHKSTRRMFKAGSKAPEDVCGIVLLVKYETSALWSSRTWRLEPCCTISWTRTCSLGCLRVLVFYSGEIRWGASGLESSL